MKHSLKRTALAVIGLLFAAGLSAQVAMTRTTFTGTYTPITTGGGATVSIASGDDGVETGIPIGFTFNYLGTPYTTLSVNTNGLVGFGVLSNVDRDNTTMYTTTAPQTELAPWYDDLATPAGNLLYQLQGTPGSQTFTIQWSATSFYTGATAVLNFQCILYEGTNVIEFTYGAQPTGTFNTASESASIGIESGTGGNGQYIDAITGSSYTGNGMLSASNMWPNRFFRFTPGAPTALPGGIYTVGVAGTYPSLSEAIADINHRGISGAVTLSLIDANYDASIANGRNFFPMMIGPVAGSSPVNTVSIIPALGTATITSAGQSTGFCVNQASTSAIGTTTEPILALVGAQYVGITGVNLVASSNLVDRGLAVLNSSAIVGSQNNAFANIGITLNRGNTSTIGIDQRLPTTPTAATGANSNNIYRNLTISNTYAGIYLLGNATFPDLNCSIGTTSPTSYNLIGASTANDIGNGTTTTYGLRCSSQSGVTVFNNEVRNVTVTGSVVVDGILIELSQGTSSVYNNRVYNIRNASTTATSNICGIRANSATSAGHNLRVYNNTVYGLTSGYTGAASATRQIKGIFAQSAGGGVVGSSVNVDNNSVYIDGSSSPNISSTCYEIGTTSGVLINTRNNVFYNATGTQTAPALHLAWRSTSATLVGNTGSVSNYNDLYVPNATQGFVGQGNTTNYATLANWQAAMTGQDVNSVSTDPWFLSTTDLHASAGLIDNVGTPVAWVTTDFENQARSVTTPDIGADEFTASTLDVGATVLVTPVSGGCYTSTETVTIRIRNYATGTHDFATDPVTVTVNVTGAVTATLNVTVNTGTLASGATQDIVVGTLNMTTSGTYVFNASTALTGDQNAANNSMPQTSINFLAGTATAAPASLCPGASVTLTLSGNSASTLQWQESTDGGITWNSIPGGTTSPFSYMPTDTSLVRAMVCGSIPSTTASFTVHIINAPVTVNDTVCGLGSLTMSASGVGVLRWYDEASGGTLVNSGSTYTTTLAQTDTFYVQGESGATNSTHTTTYAAGNGSSGNCFTVKALTNLTVNSFDGHLSSAAGTPSTWEIWYRPNDYLLTPGSHLSNAGWTQLGTGTVNSAGPGNPTPIPVALSLTIPMGQTYSFQIFTTTGSVSYTNGTVLGALYNANADLEVYQGHGGTAFSGMVNSPRVFNGRINYTTGCASSRTPVIGVVLPAPPVAAVSSNDICSGQVATLQASSINAGYDYVWAPAASLNTANGDSVIAAPSTMTTYTVTATDSVSGCVDTAMVTVNWYQSPTITATAAPDTICSGASVNLDAAYTGGPMLYQIGTGTVTNSNTSYPAPYGNFYWGSRHQMLITAADLAASGMNAGYITALAFDVTSINLTQPLDAYEVKIGTTVLTSITTFQSGLTSVFTAAVYMPTNGLNVHTFSTPFYWDGVSNIIIETCHNNSSYIENCSFNQSTTAYTSCVYYRQDAAGVCGNAAVTGSINQRPNITFAMQNNYEYVWTPGSSLDNPLIQTPVGTPLVTTDYIVAVTDSVNGCITMDTVTVTVNPSPAPAFGPDTNICSNASLMLDGTAGAYTYLWQDSTVAQMYTATMAGVYSVVVTDTTTGCIGADTITVGIDMAPSFSLGNDTTVCAGTMVTFNGPAGMYTYAWSNGDSLSSTTTATAGSYDLVVTDISNGCSGMDTVVLNVNALPAVNLGADTAICSNAGALTLAAPSGVYSYSWNTSESTQTIAVDSAGTYAVAVFDMNTMCTGTDTITVMVNAAPSFTLGSDTTFCSNNGPVMIMGPSGPYSYLWSDSTAGSAIMVGMTGTYFVDVTDTLTGCTSRDSVMATVLMSPSFSLNDTSNCGTSVVVSGPAGAYTYLWSTTGTSQTETITASGTYSLTVTDTATGCIGMDSVMVTLNANPVVTASAAPSTVCADDANVTLTGSPAGGSFTGTSVTGNQFDPSVGAGTYSIVYTYTDVNGCTEDDTVSIQVNACVGIVETTPGNGVNVYPNPASDLFNISFAIDINGTATIEMFDAQGKLVHAESRENIGAGAVISMDVNDYESGMYMMKITSDNGTWMYKVNVQK